VAEHLTPQTGSFPRLRRQIVLAAMCAFLLKTVLALSTYGSTDVLLFEADLAEISQEGGIALYRDGVRTRWCGQIGQWQCPAFNHPPFMIYVLTGWGILARVSGLPFRFWLRFTCSVADVGSLALLVGMLTRGTADPRRRGALILFAASPTAVLISGFHGNTDPILVFFVLLSIYLIESGRPAWLAGVALGVASSFKVLPLLLAPAGMLALRGTRRKLEFSASAAIAVVAGSLPFLVAAPALVLTRVVGYRSQSGTWGLSLLILAFQAGARSAWLCDAYERWGNILSVGLVLGASLWPRPRLGPDSLLLRTGFLMYLLVASAPGFGVQYLTWLVPWVVVLGITPTAIFYLSSTLFLAAYYTAAAARFPWYLANSLERPAWNASVIGLGFVCWVVVCWVALIFARRLLAAGAPRCPQV
jgi:hypothetical protein